MNFSCLSFILYTDCSDESCAYACTYSKYKKVKQANSSYITYQRCKEQSVR